MANNLTRRGFLGNTAAVGAAGLPIRAAAAAVQTDAALFALGDKWQAADLAYQAASALHTQAEAVYFAARDALPALVSGKLTAETRAAMGSMTLADVSDRAHPANVAIAAELEAHSALVDQRQAELAEISISCGVDATERKMLSALYRVDRIARRIIATPASTVAGLVLKLRVNEHRAVEPDDMLDALAADIRAMNRGARA